MASKEHSNIRGGQSGPHAFVQPSDSRLGLSLGGSQIGGPMGPSGGILVAGASVRPVRCAAPGCGKLRDDPIHWPTE